jgi:DNA polymerase-3 subunit gamma/tau
MRDTPHTQILLEMAVVRLCRMDELLSVGQLVQALRQPGAVSVGTMPAPAAGRQLSAPPEAAAGAKKNGPLVVSASRNGEPTPGGQATVSLSESTLPEVWGLLIRSVSDKAPILANHLKFASSYAIFGPNALAIRFHSEYNHAREACSSEANTRRIQDALTSVTGHPAQVRFEQVSGPAPAPEAARATRSVNGTGDRKKQLMGLPLFKKAGEALGAQIWHVDDEFNPAAPPREAKAVEDRTDEPDTDET